MTHTTHVPFLTLLQAIPEYDALDGGDGKAACPLARTRAFRRHARRMEKWERQDARVRRTARRKALEARNMAGRNTRDHHLSIRSATPTVRRVIADHKFDRTGAW